MKWFKNSPVKTGLYWILFPGKTEAQVVMVIRSFGKDRFKFQIIGDDEFYDINEAKAWCSKRPMKPQVPVRRKK